MTFYENAEHKKLANYSPHNCLGRKYQSFVDIIKSGYNSKTIQMLIHGTIIHLFLRYTYSVPILLIKLVQLIFL